MLYLFSKGGNKRSRRVAECHGHSRYVKARHGTSMHLKVREKWTKTFFRVFEFISLVEY